MLLRVAAFALAFTLPAAALAQNLSATFDLQSAGKSIGKDTYTLAHKNGYKLSSRPSYRIGGNDASTSNDFRYDDALAFLQGSTNDIAAQSLSSYSPNKPRTELVISSVKNGIQDSKRLVIKPDLIVLPALDAGAAQAALLLAITHPTASNLYSVLVPASTSNAPAPGSDADTSAFRAPSGNFAYDALWQKAAETTGTFEGKPIPVHTFTLTSGKIVWTFFADDANTLLELDSTLSQTSCIRAHFQLTKP